MEAYICKTCGVQCAPGESPPEHCIICEDERQYVGLGGQQWTTLTEMKAGGYENQFAELEPGLTSIGTRPWFGIGQRALLAQTSGGNVLWDCITFLDETTVDNINALGGVQAIAVSHPHFYGTIIEWSRAFGGAPVYLPRDDEQWITRPDPAIQLWGGSHELWPGVTLVQCGGHFEGSAVLNWAAGAEGRGALLTGDTIAVAQDQRYVTFMRSYPNYMPLNETQVRRIAEAVRPYAYGRIYGGFWTSVVRDDAAAAVKRSAERYVRLIRS